MIDLTTHCLNHTDQMAVILLFVTVILISLSGFSMAATYRVGDSVGWTITGHPDYKKWASTKRFHVGDTLIFTYHKQYHDVMEVNQKDYVHCNINYAKAFYHSGSDSITLTKPGNFYFICSSSGHCQTGQKLHIEVHHPLHSSSLLDTTPSIGSGGGDDGSASVAVLSTPADQNPSSNDADIHRASCLTHTIALVMALCIYFLV